MCSLGRNDLRRIFEKLDRNGDGVVSLEELSWLLERIGQEYHPDELKSLLCDHQNNPDSSLNFEEFLQFCDSILGPRPQNDSRKKEEEPEKDQEILDEETEMKDDDDDEDYEKDLFKAFSVFDLNGDGFISCDELQRVLSRLGMWDEKGGQDCRSMIGAYDKNLDGVLDFEEFKSMMLQTV